MRMRLAHKYRVVSGGDFVPGVTTCINVNDKPALKWAAAEIAAQSVIENWRKKTAIIKKHREWLCNSRGNTPATLRKRELGLAGTDLEVFRHWARGEFDRTWRAKADRGTRVHEVADLWSRGERDVAIDIEDTPWIDALEQFHVMYKPKFKLVECIVINIEHQFGGRFDTIAELDGPDAEGTFLCDYKTGGHYAYDCALQAEGYLRSGLALWDANGNLQGYEPMPKLDGARTIYLGDDGRVTVLDPFERISHDDAWQAFLACRELYEVNKRINQTLGRDSE